MRFDVTAVQNRVNVKWLSAFLKKSSEFQEKWWHVTYITYIYIKYKILRFIETICRYLYYTK